jgi:FMN-dependent NADH-azoreductase
LTSPVGRRQRGCYSREDGGKFALADRVLISTPMWNFAIPYKLKQWFDLIVKPRLTFRFDPAQGYLPLLKNRPTVVILASGSDLSPA